MKRAGPPGVTCAVEGTTDEAIVRRIAEDAGLTLGSVFGLNGKQQVLRQLSGFNRAAERTPWVVVIDLDQDGRCAAEYVRQCLPQPAPHMHLRIAVREVEAWLLADASGIALFLGVPASRVPRDPDSLDDPKRTIVDLAARSRRRSIREEIAPRPGSGREVGPMYSSRISEFAGSIWNPDAAAANSDSLPRCIKALQRLLQRLGP